MTRLFPVILLLLSESITTPAAAWRCPHGQLFRVRLDQCVSLTSPLARPYVGVPHLQRSAAVPRSNEDHNWYVEITRLPDDVGRDRALDRLRDQLIHQQQQRQLDQRDLMRPQ